MRQILAKKGGNGVVGCRAENAEGYAGTNSKAAAQRHPCAVRDQRKQGRSASACRSSKEKSLVGRVVRSRFLPQGDGAVREVQIEKLRGAQLRQN